MIVKNNFLPRVLLLLGFLGLWTACQKEELQDTTTAIEKPLPNLNLVNYEMFTLDAKAIFDNIEEQSGRDITVDLGLETHPEWVFEMKEYQVFAKDAKQIEVSENGQREVPIQPGFFLYGYVKGTDTKAVIVSWDNRVQVQIRKAEGTFLLEPLTDRLRTGAANQYVGYFTEEQPKAMTACDAAASEASTDMEITESRPAQEAMGRVVNPTREVELTIVSENTFYQYWGPTTWNVVPTIVMFAGEAFWLQSNFDLTTRIKSHAVMTSSGWNVVTTHPATTSSVISNLRTFATNHASWIPRYDLTVLFTDATVSSNYGGGLVGGGAAQSQLCRSSYHSYIFATTLNGSISDLGNRVAHEIGHEAGATHTSQNSIMKSPIGGNSFSTHSKAQMNYYLSTWGYCL